MLAPLSRELVEALLSEEEERNKNMPPQYIGRGEHRYKISRGIGNPTWRYWLAKLPRTGDERIINKLILFPTTLPNNQGMNKTYFLSIRKVRQLCTRVMIQPRPEATWVNKEWI